MLPALICLPFVGALACWFVPADPPRRLLLVLVAFAELVLAALCWFFPPASVWGEIFVQDDMGRIVLTLTCILFFAASVYAVGYLHDEDKGVRKDFFQGLHFSNAPEANFTACMLLFLASTVLVASTHHFGILWVGIETTTLVSAPLIYFHRHARSLEATWKYLMICSVGIALALVGNLFLDISMQTEAITAPQMTLGHLLVRAETTLHIGATAQHAGWFKAGFVFLLIGYGTKMGIAPMHTWLPDAHSEAPSLVSALLSGALLNCAFLGIFRVCQVALAANMGQFASGMLIFFGMLSLLAAALFIVGQGDFKRLLAYSSVEHMGILLLGLGLTAGYFASGAESAAASGVQARAQTAFVLHMVCHSLVKAALFMLAGNILAKYHTKSCHDAPGLARTLPFTGALWLGGIFAITGTPPFGIFMSEFGILQAILWQGQSAQWLVWGTALVYLFLLCVIFIGMITPAVHMYRSKAPFGITPERRESLALTVPPAVLLCLALGIGLFMPQWLFEAFGSVVQSLAPH